MLHRLSNQGGNHRNCRRETEATASSHTRRSIRGFAILMPLNTLVHMVLLRKRPHGTSTSIELACGSLTFTNKGQRVLLPHMIYQSLRISWGTTGRCNVDCDFLAAGHSGGGSQRTISLYISLSEGAGDTRKGKRMVRLLNCYDDMSTQAPSNLLHYLDRLPQHHIHLGTQKLDLR